MCSHSTASAHGGVAAKNRVLGIRFLIVFVVAILFVAPVYAFAQTEAPGFVYAKAIRGHLIVVNWEPPLSDLSPAMTYRIYRAEESVTDVVPAYPGPQWSEVGQRIGRNATSFCDDQSKKNSTRYWYVVTAQNSTATVSAASPVNSLARGWNNSDMQHTKYLPLGVNAYRRYIGPTTNPPLEPANVTLSGADSTITVSWDPVSSLNIAKYHIYRAEASGASGVLVGVVDHPVTEFVDTAVEKYRHYWYRVVAEDSTGAEGFASIEKHFRTVASTSPPSPHTGNAAARDAETCAVCHQLHPQDDKVPGPNLLRTDEGTEVTLCLTCHDGTGSQFDVRREYTDSAMSSHAVTVTVDGAVAAEGTFTCVQCHSAHGGAEPTPKLMLVDGERMGNAVCYGSGCHGPVDPAYGINFKTAFEASVHNTEIPNPDSGTEVKCSTCHQPHASPNPWLWTSSAYRACFQCHAGGAVDLGAPDIYLRITMSADHDTQHDVLTRDQVANGTRMACQNCHNTHAVTAEKPLVDPRSPGIAPDDQWNESRQTPLAVPDVLGSSRYDARYNTFCFRCHGSADPPTSADTLPWVDPPSFGDHTRKDIETGWEGALHGERSSGAGDPQLHNGYAKEQTLSCMTCHEPHGTINNYNLRADVPHFNGTIPEGQRMLLAQQLDEYGTPIEGSYDTRFFCASCHVFSSASPPNHDSTNTNFDSNAAKKSLRYFPSGCTDAGCHVHGSTQPGRF